MDIAFKILKTRYIQIFRILKQLGWLYSIVVISVAFFLMVVLFQGENSHNKTYLIIGINVLILIGIHVNRRDKFLISSITDKPYIVYFSEYVTVSFCSITYLLFNQYFLEALLLFASCIVIGILPAHLFSKSKRKVFASWPVNPKDFEWIAGLRRSYGVLLFIYILTIISLAAPFLSLLFAWYLAVTICSFYKETESINMLLVNTKTIGAFLFSKVIAHQINYWKFIMPIVFAYGFLYQEHFIILVLFVVFVFLGLSFVVINKYSTYVPESQSGNDLLNALVFGAVLIPFLAPLPIVLLIRSTIKARKNLKEYFEP